MRPPARVGQRLAEILTPSLIVSLPALEANDAAMRASLRGTGVNLRPHTKAHKSSDVARWQMARAGPGELSGFCAQTLAEAEMLVETARAPDVLLTNQLVSPAAATRLAALAAGHPGSRVSTLVDSVAGVEALAAAASAAGARLGVLIEIECGQGRCGVAADSDEVVRLARAVEARAPALEFGGLHVYHGGIQHVRGTSERREAVASGPTRAAAAALSALGSAGIKVPSVTGGGTGTWLHELESRTHTEMQPGSYLFMDTDYAANDEAYSSFAQALFVHTTVISAQGGGRRIVDGGSKGVDLLCGPPRVTSIESAELSAALSRATFSNLGDEHGLLCGVDEGVLPVGATLQLVPSHCDPAVNLHDHLVGVRDGVVECVWPIDARGH